MPINKNEITKEMLEKAMQCKTADELMALAKSEGMEITREEAEAYLADGTGEIRRHGNYQRRSRGISG